MRKAIRECYPAATLRGCWYHYSAALRKRLLHEGLRKLMKDNDDAVTVKKMMMGLPLLPREHFEAGYSFIKQFAKDVKLFEKFEEFFAYYDRYWCDQVIIILTVTIFQFNINIMTRKISDIP